MTSFNGFASEIEQLNQMFGRNWLDLLVKEPTNKGAATRKLTIMKLIKVEDYETSQLPDFHIAKGSMTRSLHRTALRRPHEPLIRNFRRLYSIIARS